MEEIMKKAIILAVFLILSITATADQNKEKTLRLEVDPRLELLSIAQYLSGYGDRLKGTMTTYDFQYVQEIDEYFGPFKDHPVTHFIDTIALFSYDAPPTMMLYLSDPPELKNTMPFSQYLKNRAWGEQNLEKFVNYLRDFALKSGFMSFYNSHRDFYDNIIQIMTDTLGDANYIAELEDYYGMENNSYTIIMVPLYKAGGYGPRMERPDGTYHIYNICGTFWLDNDIPVFGNSRQIKNLAWHEFGHSFVNPLTEKYKEEINKYSNLFEPINIQMSSQAYSNWQTCVNEHLVRAVTTRLALIHDGEKEAERARQYELRHHFIYIDSLLAALEIYENKRDKYPAFESFYPEFLNVFEKYSNIPYENIMGNYGPGPINNVVGDKDNIIYVVSTNEKDKSAQRDIHEYVQSIRDKFAPTAQIIHDTTAIERDLGEYSIICYGTVDGNLWVKEKCSELKNIVQPDGIISERKYEGGDLRFITVRCNPDNSARGIVIYTAQKASDIPKINFVFHGPTDYVIARGKKIIQESNYFQKNGKLSFTK